MTDHERMLKTKDRFLRDTISTRLGNLASSLARLATSARHPERSDTVSYLLLETESFIDWTGPQVAREIQSDLAELQVELARWRLRYGRLPREQVDSEALAAFARESSQRVLEWSGLLEKRE